VKLIMENPPMTPNIPPISPGNLSKFNLAFNRRISILTEYFEPIFSDVLFVQPSFRNSEKYSGHNYIGHVGESLAIFKIGMKCNHVK
jgi:hypothetical protein